MKDDGRSHVSTVAVVRSRAHAPQICGACDP